MAPPGRPTLAPLLLLLSGPAAAGAFAPPTAARRAQPFLLPPLRFGPAIGTFGDGGEEEVRPPGVPADADAVAADADAVAAMDAAAWEADALEAALAADAKEAAEDAAAAAAMAGSQQTAPAQAAPPPPPPAAPGQDVMTAPASTTPQLMATIWEVIAQGPTMTRGDSVTVLLPEMEGLLTAPYLERLTSHLDACKDVCDDFGVNTVLVPHVDPATRAVSGLVVRSYRNPEVIDEQSGDYNFAPDPFWSEDEDWDSLAAEIEEIVRYEDDDEAASRVDDGEGGSVDLSGIAPVAAGDLVPADDARITDVTKKWVGRMMADLGICPFTADDSRSGMPVGPVHYCVDRSSRMEDAYADFWREVVRVENAEETELSTTLQIMPEFCMDNVEVFESFSNTLTQSLEALGVEDLLQLIFFHPDWTFRDGGERSGMGSAANYARRSPWPMINILRTHQVRAAQRGIPTGLVYQQNEKTLGSVGVVGLETMLRKRDWSDVEDLRVNRRDMEALRIAQDYRETGEVAEEDRDVVHDATPAAARPAKEQIEGGNIVNVVLEALEKRLGIGEGEGVPQPLAGPETSAAMMASDFLLDHLNKVQPAPPGGGVAKGRQSSPLFEEDLNSCYDEDRAADEMSVLFGGKGLMD